MTYKGEIYAAEYNNGFLTNSYNILEDPCKEFYCAPQYI